MGKHDLEGASSGSFLNGAKAVKKVGIFFRKNIKYIGIVALFPIVAGIAYLGANYYNNNKTPENESVPVVASVDNDDEKEYIGGYEVVGEIKINNLGIDVKVLNPKIDGTSYVDDALEYGAVEYYGNGINEIGNCTILGHNNSKVFFNLKNIEIDDQIVVSDANENEITYTVVSIEQVEPDDLSCLLSIDEDATELTLITCEEGATTRLVVKAATK